MYSTLNQPTEPGPPLHVRVRTGRRASFVSKLSDSDFNIDYNLGSLRHLFDAKYKAETEAEEKEEAFLPAGEGGRAIAMMHDEHRNANINGRESRESTHRHQPSYRRLQSAPARPSASQNNAAERSPTAPGRRHSSAEVKRSSHFSALRAVNVQHPPPPSIVWRKQNRDLLSNKQQSHHHQQKKQQPQQQQKKQRDRPPCYFIEMKTPEIIEMKTPKIVGKQELNEFRRRADPAADARPARAKTSSSLRRLMARAGSVSGRGNGGNGGNGRRRNSHGSGVGQVRLNTTGNLRLSFRKKKDTQKDVR